MKWARVKPSGRTGKDPYLLRDDAESFKDFPTEEHMRKAFEHLSHRWVHHEFCFPFETKEEYLKFQKRYQLFCGGYLYFYDEQQRSGAVDHAIYFKWSPFKSKNKEYSVSIYLTPAPLRKKTNEAPHRKRMLEQNEEETMHKEANGMDTQVLPRLKTATVMAKESDGDAIDPPPPPPPPPPSMQGDN
jgi:hypothetical protein